MGDGEGRPLASFDRRTPPCPHAPPAWPLIDRTSFTVGPPRAPMASILRKASSLASRGAPSAHPRARVRFAEQGSELIVFDGTCAASSIDALPRGIAPEPRAEGSAAAATAAAAGPQLLSSKRLEAAAAQMFGHPDTPEVHRIIPGQHVDLSLPRVPLGGLGTNHALRDRGGGPASSSSLSALSAGLERAPQSKTPLIQYGQGRRGTAVAPSPDGFSPLEPPPAGPTRGPAPSLPLGRTLAHKRSTAAIESAAAASAPSAALAGSEPSQQRRRGQRRGPDSEALGRVVVLPGTPFGIHCDAEEEEETGEGAAATAWGSRLEAQLPAGLASLGAYSAALAPAAQQPARAGGPGITGGMTCDEAIAAGLRRAVSKRLLGLSLLGVPPAADPSLPPGESLLADPSLPWESLLAELSPPPPGKSLLVEPDSGGEQVGDDNQMGSAPAAHLADHDAGGAAEAVAHVPPRVLLHERLAALSPQEPFPRHVLPVSPVPLDRDNPAASTSRLSEMSLDNVLDDPAALLGVVSDRGAASGTAAVARSSDDDMDLASDISGGEAHSRAATVAAIKDTDMDISLGGDHDDVAMVEVAHIDYSESAAVLGEAPASAIIPQLSSLALLANAVAAAESRLDGAASPMPSELPSSSALMRVAELVTSAAIPPERSVDVLLRLDEDEIVPDAIVSSRIGSEHPAPASVDISALGRVITDRDLSTAVSLPGISHRLAAPELHIDPAVDVVAADASAASDERLDSAMGCPINIAAQDSPPALVNVASSRSSRVRQQPPVSPLQLASPIHVDICQRESPAPQASPQQEITPGVLHSQQREHGAALGRTERSSTDEPQEDAAAPASQRVVLHVADVSEYSSHSAAVPRQPPLRLTRVGADMRDAVAPYGDFDSPAAFGSVAAVTNARFVAAFDDISVMRGERVAPSIDIGSAASSWASRVSAMFDDDEGANSSGRLESPSSRSARSSDGSGSADVSAASGVCSEFDVPDRASSTLDSEGSFVIDTIERRFTAAPSLARLSMRAHALVQRRQDLAVPVILLAHLPAAVPLNSRGVLGQGLMHPRIAVSADQVILAQILELQQEQRWGCDPGLASMICDETNEDSEASEGDAVSLEQGGENDSTSPAPMRAHRRGTGPAHRIAGGHSVSSAPPDEPAQQLYLQCLADDAWLNSSPVARAAAVEVAEAAEEAERCAVATKAEAAKREAAEAEACDVAQLAADAAEAVACLAADASELLQRCNAPVAFRVHGTSPSLTPLCHIRDVATAADSAQNVPETEEPRSADRSVAAASRGPHLSDGYGAHNDGSNGAGEYDYDFFAAPEEQGSVGLAPDPSLLNARGTRRVSLSPTDPMRLQALRAQPSRSARRQNVPEVTLAWKSSGSKRLRDSSSEPGGSDGSTPALMRAFSGSAPSTFSSSLQRPSLEPPPWAATDNAVQDAAALLQHQRASPQLLPYDASATAAMTAFLSVMLSEPPPLPGGSNGGAASVDERDAHARSCDAALADAPGGWGGGQIGIEPPCGPAFLQLRCVGIGGMRPPGAHALDSEQRGGSASGRRRRIHFDFDYIVRPGGDFLDAAGVASAGDAAGLDEPVPPGVPEPGAAEANAAEALAIGARELHAATAAMLSGAGGDLGGDDFSNDGMSDAAGVASSVRAE